MITYRSVPWTRTLLVASEKRGNQTNIDLQNNQYMGSSRIIVVDVMDEKDVVHGEIQCSVVPGQVG